MPINPFAAIVNAASKGVEGARRSLGLLGPAVLALAVILGLSAPAGAAPLEVRVIEKPKVVTLQLQGTSLLAWDLCWSPSADAVRQRLALEASAQMTGPGPFVLRIPQLPSSWMAASVAEIKDASGQVIPRSRISRGKNTYTNDVEAALLDLLSRVRELKPQAMIAFRGYEPRTTSRGREYAKLREQSDFAYIEENLASRLRHTDQRRPVDWQAQNQRPWLVSLGMSDETPVVIRSGDTWMVVSIEDLPRGFVERAQSETAAETPEPAQPVEQPAPAPAPEPVVQRVLANPDINGDGVVNAEDRALLLAAWNTTNASCDLNGDGRVNSPDLAILLGSFSPPTQAPAQVAGVFTPESPTYTRNSQVNLGFTINANAPLGANVVFHLTPAGATQPLIVHQDGSAPFVLPWQLINAVPLGDVELKALVRNSESAVVATFTRGMTFIASAVNDDGHEPGSGGQGGQDGQGGGTPPPGGAPTTPPATSTDLLIGMNVGGMVYYGREIAFSNVLSTAGLSYNGTRFGPRGLPQPQGEEIAHFLMLRETHAAYPAGEFTIRGEGSVEWCVIGFDLPRTEWERVGPGPWERRVRIDRPGESGLQIAIRKVDPAHPLKDLKVLMPNAAADHPFNPEWLERLRPFQLIRLMPWCALDSSPTAATRTTLDHALQSREQGVAVELMADLANVLDTDIWYCVPHRATDDFVRAVAQVFKQRLEPGRKLYLEFSNEVWNFVFDSAQWNNQQAMSRGISFQENYRRNSMRVFGIFQEVFGDQMSTRVRRVLGTQLHNHGVTFGILDAYAQGTADVLSPAFYFYCDIPEQQITDATPMASIIESARNNIRTTLRQHTDFIVDMGRRKGLEVIGYEGGQHLANVFGGSGAAIRRYAEANRDPRMYELYQEFLAVVKNAGVRGFAHLGYISDQHGQYGAWGALNSQNQNVTRTSAPKYQALLDFMAQEAAARSATRR